VFDAAGEAAGAAAVPNRDFTSDRRGPARGHEVGGDPATDDSFSMAPTGYAGADDRLDDDVDDELDDGLDPPPPVTEAPRNLPPVDAESAQPLREPPLA
jgi:hypothetical protein